MGEEDVLPHMEYQDHSIDLVWHNQDPGYGFTSTLDGAILGLSWYSSYLVKTISSCIILAILVCGLNWHHTDYIIVEAEALPTHYGKEHMYSATLIVLVVRLCWVYGVWNHSTIKFDDRESE